MQYSIQTFKDEHERKILYDRYMHREIAVFLSMKPESELMVSELEAATYVVCQLLWMATMAVKFASALRSLGIGLMATMSRLKETILVFSRMTLDILYVDVLLADVMCT